LLAGETTAHPLPYDGSGTGTPILGFTTKRLRQVDNKAPFHQRREIMLSRKCHLSSAVALVAAMFGAALACADEKPGAESPHYRAKQILGSKVSLEGNTEVGTVDDIVLDDSGNVDYLIVINSDDKLVTVPWDATKFNAEKRYAVVRIAPDKFKKVPTYTVEQYPVFSTPTYRTQTYRYYGLTPAAERRLMREGTVAAP
jgi:sporulation protein YlmC with PRC-barrel domain